MNRKTVHIGFLDVFINECGILEDQSASKLPLLGFSLKYTDDATILGKAPSGGNETTIDIKFVVNQARLMAPAATEVLVRVAGSLLK